MLKYKIITDSSSSITQEEADKMGIIVLPLTLSYNGKEYMDGIDITTDEFYEMIFSEENKKAPFPKSSMVGPNVFKETFEKLLKEGYTPVVLPIAKVLSGTYQSAVIARDMFEDEIIVVEDSTTALGSVKVMIEGILSDEYENVEALKAKIDYLKKHINFFAVPATLENLVKGGRLNKIKGLIGQLLHFKPIIQLDKNGTLIPIEKVRGLKHAFRGLCENLKKWPIDFKYKVHFGYSTVIENVKELVESCKELLTGQYDIMQISPVVGAHVGPGASAIFYVSTEEVDKDL